MSREPAGALVRQLATSREVLVVSSDFVTTPPDLLFAYWTQPALLQQWWPPAAEIAPQVGGTYHLAWSAQGWHLRGHYTAFMTGRQLTFTWLWDHEPDSAAMVSVAFLPLGTMGTQLSITHGPYSDTAQGQERRQGNLDGWRHFMRRLHDVVAAEITAR